MGVVTLEYTRHGNSRGRLFPFQVPIPIVSQHISISPDHVSRFAGQTWKTLIFTNNEGEGSTFTWMNVTNYDRSWIYNPYQNGWVTSDLKIQPGVYTIYAASKPVSMPVIPELCCIDFKVITLLEPTLDATITPDPYIRDCCSRPNCVPIIRGNSTGNEFHKIEYWVFGEQKIGDKHYYHGYIEDCCGDFEINLCDTLTQRRYHTQQVNITLCSSTRCITMYLMLSLKGISTAIRIYATQFDNHGEQNKLYVIGSCPIRWSKYFPIEGADALRETGCPPCPSGSP